MSSLKNINSFGKVKMIKCTPTFMWVINNFCACHSKTSDPLKSPTFSMGSNDELKWSIHLYPRGFDKNYRNYVSVFLNFESEDQGDVKIKYKFSILNNKNVQTNETASDNERLFTPGCDWGFREFVSRDYLFDEKNGLLPDNKLTLYCEIDINKYNTNIFTGNTIIPIKLCDNQTQVLNDLEALFRSRKYSDVIFVVKDKKFHAHKAILAARSTVFSTMFEQDVEDKQTNVIEINDFDEKIMKEILRYIYIGKVEDLNTIARNLLPVCIKYELKDLKVMCEDAISKSLNIDNVTNILIEADYYNSSNLKRKAMDFIILNGKSVTDTEGFKAIVTSHPHLIAEAFQTMASQYSPSEAPIKKRKRSEDYKDKEK